jgi:ribose-phosphate pyrophosphokinase
MRKKIGLRFKIRRLNLPLPHKIKIMPSVKLFSGTNSLYLAEKIADEYGEKLGDLTVSRFSDGEMQPVINESVRGDNLFFIQSTFAPAENLLELLLMIDAAKRASAGYITAVIPYYGYARQDRKDKPRVPISAKLIANMLQAAGIDRIMTMDLHADQLQGFFDIPVDHLKSEPIFAAYIKSNFDLSNLLFASPDLGGIKRARNFARLLGREFVTCSKYRKKANEIAEMNVIGDVEGMDVVLVDDLIDTAGTLCKAAEVIMDKGAKSVRAMATHPVLSGKAYENIENSKLLEVIVLDTIPTQVKSSKIKVISTAKLFARAIRHTHENKSIESLFE